jgi:KDO2-lipid IV(A) lauroyltransferase
MGASINWKRRQIALRNLLIVFPDKTESERKQILSNSLVKMLKNYYEIVMVVSKNYSKEAIVEMARADGLEQLDSIVRKGTGALLYSGHIGNFPLLTLWLGVKGYPIAAIYKEAKNFPDDFYGDIMRSFGVFPLKYRSDASLTASILRALKQKKIILIQNDQSVPEGIYIKFFDRYVPSAGGPAILAERTRVPVIPVYIIRDEKNHHTINILPEIILDHDGNHEELIRKNVQLLADWIAAVIKENPSEWLWLHNRWKREKRIDEIKS